MDDLFFVRIPFSLCRFCRSYDSGRNHLRMYKTGILLLFCLLAVSVFAQSPADSVKMDSVVISATRNSVFAAGIKTVRYDSATAARYSNSGIGDLLGAESELFIKSYGAGSTATSSFRGGGASHTAMIWNGISLTSPTHGLTDLSLLPMLFIDEVSIQYGGSGTLWGSGNVGGAVLLNSFAADTSFRTDISANYASFGNYQLAVRSAMGGKKSSFVLRGFTQAGENNFPFKNYTQPGSPVQYQQNSSFSQWGIMPGFSYRPNEKNEFSLHGWIQFTDRKIPPSLTQSTTTAGQADGTIRFAANWNQYHERAKFVLRTALLNDLIDYTDSAIALYSSSRAWNLVTEGEATVRLFRGHLLQAGIINTFTQAFTETYPDGGTQNRTAVFASFAGRVWKERFNYSIGLREELVDGTFVPFIPSAGFSLGIFKWLDLRMNGTRSYRLPAFNDLYWSPGGNPDLLPETGWSSDAGLTFRFKYKKWNFESDAGTFYRRMQNWIIWLPTPMGYWAPDNVQEVLSRGMETSHTISRISGNWKTRISVRTSYVLSTNEKAKSVNDASLGKQLIYVPYNKTTASLFLQWKSISLYANYSFNGFRFVSSDNSVFLPGYSLYSARISWNGKLQYDKISCFAEANNIFDTYYEVIASRPMPGRNYRLGIQYSFVSKPAKHSRKNK